MIGFYLHAVLMNNGQTVELRVGTGSQASHEPRGAITFQRDEWEAFRVLIVAGMRACGYARIPIEFMDQTRKDLGPLQIVH